MKKRSARDEDRLWMLMPLFLAINVRWELSTCSAIPWLGSGLDLKVSDLLGANRNQDLKAS